MEFRFNWKIMSFEGFLNGDRFCGIYIEAVQ